MIEVIPSLPASTFQELRTKIELVKGIVSTFQIDVTDGIFVTGRSWPMNPGDKKQFVRLIKGEEKFPGKDELDFEVHFMTHNPEKLLGDWMKLGIIRALFHIEARHDFSTLKSVAKDEIELGVSLNIGTSIDRIDDYIEHISCVQLMGIAEIGAQGQAFDPRVLDMIREVRERYPDVIIEIDGSVNMETAPSLVEAGATRLAPGSYVFRSDDPEKAVKDLEALAS